MPTDPRDWSERSRDLARLLARTGLGDRAAFAALYRRSAAHLMGVVLRIESDRGRAEDIVQEVYVNVWRAAGQFDAAQSQPLTWLTSIARNRAIDALRRRQTQPLTESLSGSLSGSHAAGDPEPQDEDVYEHVADTADGPLALLSRASDARGLEQCMQGLSPAQRQCIALAFYDGLSHAEVAQHLRQPLGTVKSWLRRALAGLKTCLERAVQRDALTPGA
jgi:RNA polymerase sigma-70 factor (ECF subfamily)